MTINLILYNIAISLGTFLVVLLGYAYKRADGFRFDFWVRQNWMRLATGGALLILLSVLMEVAEEVDIILNAIGFNTNASPVALGLAIAMMAVGGIATQKSLDGS